MKKKRFLTVAADLCLSLALLLNPLNINFSGCIYAESEGNAENGEINGTEANYDDDEFQYILNAAGTAEGVIRSGEWLYFDKGDYISVCGYSGNEEHITIPSEIDGKEVRELSYGGNSASVYPRRFFGPGSYSEDSQPAARHITIPETVTRIDRNTFYDCDCLEQADMPEGLIYIGSNAFAFCRQLKTADIPVSVKIIKDEAFYLTAITSLNLPRGLEYIGEEAFFGTGIKQLIIPDTVKYIGRKAFSFCSLLETVKLPKGITVIPERLFESCMELKSMEIPEGVYVVGEQAFARCIKLESISIPSTVNVMSGILSENYSLKDIYYAVDNETANALTGSDFMNCVLHSDPDYEPNYSNVQIRYKEKTETPTEKVPEDNPVKKVFKVLTITFSVTLTAVLCLYALQKIKNRPKPAPPTAPIQQGNVLTSFNPSIDARLCKSCKMPGGENADYCIFCGKKLKGK